MRAEIRAGELLAEMEKNKGARGNPGGRGAKLVRSQETTAHPKLSDLGVSKTQSSRWQRLAALPRQQQEAKIAQAKQRAEAAIDVRPAAASRAKIPANIARRHMTGGQRAAVVAKIYPEPASAQERGAKGGRGNKSSASPSGAFPMVAPSSLRLARAVMRDAPDERGAARPDRIEPPHQRHGARC
jgi:hypothetical protein